MTRLQRQPPAARGACPRSPFDGGNTGLSSESGEAPAAGAAHIDDEAATDSRQIANMLSDPGAALSAALSAAGEGGSSSGLAVDGGLRSLLENKPTAAMEKLFHMWIRSADITMTDDVIGRGSYGQVRLLPLRRSIDACMYRLCVATAHSDGQHRVSWMHAQSS